MRRKILYSILNEWRDEDMDDSPIDLDDDMDIEHGSSDMDNEPDLDDDDFALSTTNHTQGFNEYMGGMHISKVDGWFFNPYYIKEPVFKAKNLKDAERIVNDYFQSILEKLNDKNLQNKAKIIDETHPINFNDIINTKDIANLLEIPEKYITRYTLYGGIMNIKVNFEKLMYMNKPDNIHHNNQEEFDTWYVHYFSHYAFLTQKDMPDTYFTNKGSLNKTIFKWSFLKDLNTDELLSKHNNMGWTITREQPVQVVSSPEDLCINLSRYNNNNYQVKFYVPATLPNKEILVQLSYTDTPFYVNNSDIHDLTLSIKKIVDAGFVSETFFCAPEMNNTREYKIRSFDTYNYIEIPSFYISTSRYSASVEKKYIIEQAKRIKYALGRTVPYYNFVFRPTKNDLKLYKNEM